MQTQAATTGDRTTAPTWIDVFLDVPRAVFADSARFWSAATGARPSPVRGEDGQFLTLVPQTGDSWVRLQAHDEPARVHLDVSGGDRAALLDRALAAGAEPAWRYADVPVLRSPGGLLLCITVTGHAPRMTRAAASILDQVCLDIPARLWEREVEFWRALTGRELTAGRAGHFVRLVDPDPAGAVRLLLQRTDDDRAEVSAHPDFAVADRDAESRRHRALGAVVVAQFPGWTILRSPDGLPYCLTDRDPATGLVG